MILENSLGSPHPAGQWIRVCGILIIIDIISWVKKVVVMMMGVEQEIRSQPRWRKNFGKQRLESDMSIAPVTYMRQKESKPTEVVKVVFKILVS